MTEALLQTKLYAPPLQPHLVSRPRLIERLNKGLEEKRKLTLISTPAGFGKTTLVAEWRFRIPDLRDSRSVCQNPKFGWLSLDQSDNDTVRFLSYLLAAIRRIIPGIGESAAASLGSSQPPPPELFLAPILNDITTMLRDGTLQNCCYMLVVDDYHVIQDQSVHNIMQFFVENIPRPLHLTICSRADLSWSLARMRASGQINELRAADLRFTPSETSDFLNKTMGFNLSSGDIAALDERTEGWIAGLQLAALSMQGLDASGRHRFVSEFAGSSRYIVDYLVDEVLDHRPSGTKEFLLHTSVLDRMSGPLCDAVMAWDGDMPASRSQEILEQLEQSNLFLIPLDDKRQWYRYHHLFGDLLRVRLKQMSPGSLVALHRRASRWYKSEEYWDDAIRHALAAGDIGEAVRLIESNAAEIFINSELSRLRGWIDSLPDAAVQEHPWISIYHAWVLRLTGAPYADVEARLEDIENALKKGVASSAIGEDEARHIAGHTAAIRAYQALFSEKLDQVKTLGYQALEQLPPDSFMRSSVSLAIGWAARFSGDLAAGARAFEEARDVSLLHNNHYIAVTATCRLAYTQILAGKLRQAADSCREALNLAAAINGQQLPVAGYALVYLGSIYRETNNLEAASDYLARGIDLCSRVGFILDQIVGYSTLARVRLAQGERGASEEACAAAWRLSQQMKGYIYAQRWAEDCRIRFWLAEDGPANGLGEAFDWAQESGMAVDDELDFVHELAHILLARVLVAHGSQRMNRRVLRNAHRLLANLLVTAERAGWFGKVIEILVLQSLAFQAEGRLDEALIVLGRALDLAEPQGYVRVFADEGRPMARLLYKAMERDISPQYTGRLLAQFPAREPEPQRQTDMVEPLTKRELDVLLLVVDGGSNAEIASELSITVGTVKNHLKNIYGKLGVHSRVQATAKAREFGLFE